jgi:hypothetical protein
MGMLNEKYKDVGKISVGLSLVVIQYEPPGISLHFQIWG